MGKIKERRFRYHKKLVKASILNAGKNENKQDEETVDVEQSDMPLSTKSNIFEGTEINLDAILGFGKKDTDCKSVSGVSKKELKKEEQGLSKKDKIKLRREKFLQSKIVFFLSIFCIVFWFLELEVIYADKKTKKKKNKKKQVQTFDMVPFLVSLPSATETTEKSQPVKKKPSRISMKAKQRLKEKYVNN